MKRLFNCIPAILLLFCGCQSDQRQTAYDMNRTLKLQNKELEMQVEQLKAQNQELQDRVRTLSGLKPTQKMEALSRVQSLNLSNRSGLYDKDRDGSKESLMVYLAPRDQSGDAVKAAGSLEVQLWDLEQNQATALLKAWELGPDELRDKWTAGLLGGFYRLTFPIEDLVEYSSDQLTLKVEFTDYTTGKVYREQITVER